MSNVVEQLRTSVEDVPQQPAIVTPDGEEMLYREFWIECGRFAGGLRNEGVGTGDRIGVSTEPSPELLIAIYGALRNGSVVVPLPPQNDPEPILADADVEGVVGSVDRLEDDLLPTIVSGFRVAIGGDAKLAIDFETFTNTTGLHDFWETIRRGDDDPAILAYTGPDPVGIPLTNRNLTVSTAAVSDLVPDGMSAADTLLAAVPTADIGTITSVISLSLFNSATIVPLWPWSTDVTDVIDQRDVTMIAASPSVLGDLGSIETGSVRTIGVNGPAPGGKTADIMTEVAEQQCYQVTGVAEACGVSHGSASIAATSGGSVGQPLSPTRASIVSENNDEVPAVDPGVSPDEDEVGKLLVAGESVTPGGGRDVVEHGGEQWIATGRAAYHDTNGDHYVNL